MSGQDRRRVDWGLRAAQSVCELIRVCVWFVGMTVQHRECELCKSSSNSYVEQNGHFRFVTLFSLQSGISFYHASKQNDLISVSCRGQTENDAKLLFYSPHINTVQWDKHIKSDVTERRQQYPVTLTSCGIEESWSWHYTNPQHAI